MLTLTRKIPDLHYQPPLGAFAPGSFDPDSFAEADLAAEQFDSVTRAQKAAVDKFYASDRLGLRFGQLYKMSGVTYRSLGLDVVWPAGTAIPAWFSGKVVAREYSSTIGYCIVIETTRKNFVTFCHVINRIPVGTKVEAGHMVARVAGYTQPHGSAWTGPHTAVHFGTSIASWFGIGAKDPLPSILANR